MVPADAEGVTVHGDWDALGMRASGSHSVTFDAVALPAPALRGGFPVGDADGYMSRNLNAGLFHAAASLGIAEAAQDQALDAARRADDARTRALVAESAMDLSAARGALSRAALLVDEQRDEHRRGAVRRGTGGEDVHQRRRVPRRRPRARPRRRRRLQERPPARPRLSRRPRRCLHAPARREPRL